MGAMLSTMLFLFVAQKSTPTPAVKRAPVVYGAERAGKTAGSTTSSIRGEKRHLPGKLMKTPTHHRPDRVATCRILGTDRTRLCFLKDRTNLESFPHQSLQGSSRCQPRQNMKPVQGGGLFLDPRARALCARRAPKFVMTCRSSAAEMIPLPWVSKTRKASHNSSCGQGQDMSGQYIGYLVGSRSC